ncbi:MAG: zinc ribbon domain-containing protein [Candidatus Thorarchaeota archaeon]
MSSLKFTPCAYHNDKAAVTTCERCHRPICLEDKRVYRRTHYQNDNTYVTTHDYCILCFASQKKTDSNLHIVGAIIFIIFIIIGFGFFTSAMNNANSQISNNEPQFPDYVVFSGSTISVYSSNQTTPNGLGNPGGLFVIFLFIAIIFVIGGVIYSKTQSDQATDEALQFKRKMSNSDWSKPPKRIANSFKNNITPLQIKKKQISKINCFECGTELSPDDQYCPNCGDNTKDEMKKYLFDSS